MLAIYILLFLAVKFKTIQSSGLIDQMLTSTIKCKSNQTVGITLSVVRAAEVLFVGGYGVRDKRSQEPVTVDTLFQVASLSKAFASTLLLKLMEEKTK